MQNNPSNDKAHITNNAYDKYSKVLAVSAKLED